MDRRLVDSEAIGGPPGSHTIGRFSQTSSRRTDAMPIYQCCLFNHDGKAVSVEVLGDGDDFEARRSAMRLMVEAGQCALYEVWADGHIIESQPQTDADDPKPLR